MIKYKNTKIIEVDDWDDLVEKTYGRTYKFQQQDGCKDRGIETIRVPSDPDDYENDTIPEIVNGEERGVSFKAWLERDPKEPIQDQQYDFELSLFWERNFYPSVGMIANDLHKRGLLDEGEYIINIDW